VGVPTGEDIGMQVIAADAVLSRAGRRAIVRSAVVALLLLLAGAALAWLCLGTQLVVRFVPNGRPTALETAAGIIVWVVAIMVPAAFLIMGAARLAGVAEVILSMRPRTITGHLGATLGADHVVARNIQIPGARRIHELVLGPFGIVVLGEAPPPSASRHVGTRWEVRDSRGRWVPVEGPMERVTREADRVRGWLATDDRDFTVRVYAAVVTTDARLERTATCAVVAPGDLGDWLAALPFQRGLNADRRERLTELLRSVAFPD
jgi:hypothetical protein